jgi:hypothetical protein
MAIVTILLVLVGVLLPMGLIAYCCISGENAEEAKRLEKDRIVKETKDGYDALLTEAHFTIAAKRSLTIASTPTDDRQQMSPHSGSHVGQFQTIVEDAKGYGVKQGKEPFTADFNLSFIPDEESGEGYFITGKRIDRYGQTIITEGYMCHSRDTYWKEKYIASFARFMKSDDSADGYHDGPVVTDLGVVVLGKFKDNNGAQMGKMTFRGQWSCQHIDIPGGKMKMDSQAFGSNIAVAVAVAVAVGDNVPAEVVLS